MTLDLSDPRVYTLLEADFSDTNFFYRHFDQAPYDNEQPEWGCTMTQVSAGIEARWYSPLSVEDNLQVRQDALYALHHRQKMVNRYPDWRDIPFEYLEAGSSGFSFLAPEAYRFYTPAILNCFYEDPVKIRQSLAYFCWSFPFLNQDRYTEADHFRLNIFSDIQLEFIGLFLRFAKPNEYAE